MKTLNLLGFDFGASSGRAMLGTLADGKLEIQEIHRFSNDPVMLCGRFVWDVPRLVYEMKQALLKISHMDVKVDAIGIDTWGVDYGLLDANGHLLGLPVNYRDDRTLGMREKVREVIPDAELFARTGLAYNQFNTLYQLYAMRQEGDPTLDAAADLLFMPDLLAYLLTGAKGTEYTIASTSEMINPFTRDWDRELLEKLGIPTRMLGEVKLPGTVRGTLLPDIARECGVDEIPVIAVGGHDTASAVAAVPARDADFAYISSGTWSLLGAELQKPLCAEGVMNANYTNEGGVDGSIRLLKNIMGLWIIQECRLQGDHRRGRSLLPGPRRYARPHPGVLQKDRPGRARRAGRDQPRDLRGPGAEIPLGHRAAGEGHAGQAHQEPEHRGRRQQEHAAEPLHRRGHQAPRDRRPQRGHRHRQPADAGHRPGRDRGYLGPAPGGGGLLPHRDLHPRDRREGLGRGV